MRVDIFSFLDFCKERKQEFMELKSSVFTDSAAVSVENVWTLKQCLFLCKDSCKYATYNARRYLCLLSNSSQNLNHVHAYGWNSFLRTCVNGKSMHLIEPSFKSYVDYPRSVTKLYLALATCI